MTNWHALVVEDDLPSCQVMTFMLNYHHIDVDIAVNAEQALIQLSKKSYTCAIIDLSLPGMNGWALLKSIKNDPDTQHLPCVAVTAYYDAKVSVEAVQAGFLACFGKPVQPASFVKQLEAVISNNLA